MREILNLDFNAADFVQGIEKAINVTTELDQKLKDVANDSNKVSFNKPISELNKLKNLLSEGGNLDGFNDIFKEFDKNIPKVKAYIAELKKYLATVTNKDEYKALNAVIAQTEAAIKEVTGETKTLAKETENATKKQVTLRTEIRQNTIQLQQLERQGKQNTKEYKQLSAATSELIDMQGDLQGALRKAASDTYKIDLGLEGVQLGIGAYQTYLGVLALVGDESKELQEIMTKLLAVQQVAQGVQQIAAFLTAKEGIALELKTKWTTLSTFATQGATTAQRAFNTALVASGIGAFVVVLGLLVANWEKVTAAISRTNKVQDATINALDSIKGEMADTIETTIKMRQVFESVQKGTKNKTVAIKELSEAYGITEEKAKELLSSEQKFENGTNDFIEATRKRAIGLALIRKSAEAVAEAEINFKKGQAEGFKINFDIDGIQAAFQSLFSQYSAADFNYLKLLEAKKKANAENVEIVKEANRLITEADSDDIKRGAKRATRDVESFKSVYQERLKALQNQIQNERNLELKGLDKLNADYIQKTKERFESIEKDLAEGKLTKNEAIDLRRKAKLLSKEEYDKAVSDYKKQVLEKEYELNNELKKVKAQLTLTGQAQELSLLEIEYNIRRDVVKKQIQELSSDQVKLKRLLNEQLTALDLEQAKKSAEIAKNNLQRLYDLTTKNSSLNQSELEKNLAVEAAQLSDQYAQGLINERQYQEGLAKIEREYAQKKRDKRLQDIDSEFKSLQDRLKLDPNNPEIQKQINELIEEQARIIKESNEKTKVSAGDSLFARIFGLDPTSEKFNEDKQKILTGLKSMVDSAISIIREQTKAEIEAYDTAIRLQQERVNQAQKIADNGNAEYLQMEEERLKELEQKREAAAQRQLEIDSAIQASQMLVAIAGAAAQIAQGGIGIANVIAGIATITATVATGFALLNQLQSSRPRFFEGTEGTVAEELGRPQRSGRDGYDISVDGNEMILNGDISKKLRAKGIKASDLPTLATLGLNRVNEVGLVAAKVEAKESFKGLEYRLDRSEKVQKQMLNALKTIKVAANIDREGVASIVSSFEMDKLKSSRA